MRVVLDTNVLVAAVKSKKGMSYKLLTLLENDTFEIAVSNTLYHEYLDVLLRPDIKPSAMSNFEMQLAIEDIVKRSVYQDIYFKWRPWLDDPNDDMILELSVAAACDFIVTFNVRDFGNSISFGVKAVTPVEFFEILKERSL